MSSSERLREQRTGTVINVSSKKQESDLIKAIKRVETAIASKFDGRIRLSYSEKWYLKDIVAELQAAFPDVRFHHHLETSCMRPDGGILSIAHKSEDNTMYPILIAEAKKQGTNDLRVSEGKPRQARGNAVERLGKNLIGLRAALLRESIFPFVCFGYGIDFEPGSSILDRVTTMAMFGELNKTHLHNDASGRFNRGSFYFRREQWSVDEMTTIMVDIAQKAIFYYMSKYGERHFVHDEE